jgi:4-hydroxy-tetrahydrodipicolinate synthase
MEAMALHYGVNFVFYLWLEMLKGSLVALVTPMQPDGALDFEGLARLVEWHVESRSNGLVVVGTTGESPTVSFEEHCRLVGAAVEAAEGRIPIVAGTGANSTSEAIELTRCARKAGAAAGLSVAPYYNKPGQEGLYRHFRAVAEAVDLPMILYNVPGRTASDITNDTALRLAEIPNVIGIKDATGSIERGCDLIYRAPAEFAVYSGDDASALALMLMGGRGVISVTANVAPRKMHDMCEAALIGDLASSKRINRELFGLHRKLFVEANPIPVKWAMSQLGLIQDGIRLPLTPLADGNREAVREAMRQAGVL